MIFLGWFWTPFPPLDPRMKTHSSDVLLMVWRYACHVLWTLSTNFFLSLFMNLWSNYRLDTILMLPEFGPESGALATVGEFVLCVTMTWRHLHFKWRNGLRKQQQWIDSKWKLRKSLPHVLSDVLSNENKRVCDGKGIVAKKTAVLMWLISCVLIRGNGNEKFVGAVSVWKKIATDLLE